MVFYDNLEPEIESAISKALGVLRRLTAGLRDVALPPMSQTIAPTIVLAETYAFHGPYFLKTRELYTACIRRNLQQGSTVTIASYIQARQQLDAARRTIGEVFSNVDLLVTPTMAVLPPTIERPCALGLNWR